MATFSQKIRYVLGSVVSVVALSDFFTINNISYNENGKQKTKKMLTVLKLPYAPPSEGDLVLTIDNKKYQFKVVLTTQGNYTPINKNGFSMFVPPGFLLMRNIQTGETVLQCCGSIVGQHNFDLSNILSKNS